ncbi:MAG: penicillin-binding transpeptidase domain-containing protein [Clostridiales bacterium]
MYKNKFRFNIITIIVSLIFLVILFQLINLQIVNGAKLENESQHKFLKDRRITAPRGLILDRNGEILATNRMSFSVDIAKTSQSEDELNSMILKLVNIFEKNNDFYEINAESNLKNYLEFNPLKFGVYLNKKSTLKRWKNDIANNKNDIKKLDKASDVFKYLKNKFNVDKNYNDSQAYKIITIRYALLINGYTIMDSLKIANDISLKSVHEIEEKSHQFPGVSTNIESKRKYLCSDSYAHILGYTAKINSAEYNNLESKGYYMNDFIGKMGIEKYAENSLRGKDGEKSVEVDLWNKEFNEINSTPEIPGDNVTLTIDSKLQNVAYNSLKKTITDIRTGIMGGTSNYHDTYFGSVVAMDVNSGEILALASYPSFNPSIFLDDEKNKESQKAIAELYVPSNTKTSQYNRAITGLYPPGSTFKPLVSICGLEEGVITKNSIINDPGYMYVEGVKLSCLEWRSGLGAHGNQTLRDGLKTSCNMFFYNLGMMIGIEKIDSWSKYFGLGEKTGIEIPGEEKGLRSNPKTHELKGRDYAFGKVSTANTSIGQGDNLFSPIQLASYTSTIASRGKKYNPHIIKTISNNSGNKKNNTKIEYTQLKLNESSINAVEEGMVDVTISGTASGAFSDLPFSVAAKTGTAETGVVGHSDNAVFIAYAPVGNPKIAIAIVVERGVYGSFTAPIAHDIFQEYLVK